MTVKDVPVSKIIFILFINKHFMTKKIYMAIIILGIAFALGMGVYSQGNDDSSVQNVVMYKSPNCGCCTQHSAYMEESGFSVDIKPIEDMNAIKKQFQIPKKMQSCHTAIIGDYFVEGHIPAEAINKLLTEKPDIDGIALPEMPSGSPGMPGQKLEPFTIYQLKNGKSTIYTKL